MSFCGLPRNKIPNKLKIKICKVRQRLRDLDFSENEVNVLISSSVQRLSLHFTLVYGKQDSILMSNF